jgi:hypothetical protein
MQSFPKTCPANGIDSLWLAGLFFKKSLLPRTGDHAPAVRDKTLFGIYSRSGAVSSIALKMLQVPASAEDFSPFE